MRIPCSERPAARRGLNSTVGNEAATEMPAGTLPSDGHQPKQWQRDQRCPNYDQEKADHA